GSDREASARQRRAGTLAARAWPARRALRTRGPGRRGASDLRAAPDDLEGRRSNLGGAKGSGDSPDEARPRALIHRLTSLPIHQFANFSPMYPGRFMPGPLDILDIRARIRVRLRVRTALAAELEDTIAQAAQERAIVRD